MNPDVLNCYKYLHADQPKAPSKSANEWTKDCLRKVGWSDGMYLPTGLDEYIVAVLDVLGLKHGRHEVEDIFELDEVKSVLRAAIEKCNNLAVDDDEIKKAVVDALGEPSDNSPTTRQIYEMAEAVERARREKEASNLTPDAPEEETVIQHVHVETPEEAPAEDKTTYDDFTRHTYCPRCGLMLNDSYMKPELTETDKRNYLICMLGGQPFTKDVELFNGLVTVTFTTLTTKQEELLRDQLGWESIKHGDEAAILAGLRNDDCRLALQVKALKSNVKDLNVDLKSIPSFESDLFTPDSDNTRLGKYADAWYTHVVRSQPLKLELRRELSRFNALVNTLSIEAFSKDFWPRATVD